jgi:hypothetical protein
MYRTSPNQLIAAALLCKDGRRKIRLNNSMVPAETYLFLMIALLSTLSCLAQRKVTNNLILKVDQAVSEPLGEQKSSYCLGGVYGDGGVLSVLWWNLPFGISAKDAGQKSRPEHMLFF